MRVLLIFFLLFIGLRTGHAQEPLVNWSIRGIDFGASPQDFNAMKELLLKASLQIANTITKLESTEIPASFKGLLENKLLIIFETNFSTDAAFFPPHTRGGNKDFVISIKTSMVSSNSILRLFAHEYFHAIHYAVNPNEESWIREGLAQLFEHMIFGGFNYAHIHEGLTSSHFPLEAEINPQEYIPEKYGNTLLYFYYLFSQCSGQKDFLWAFLSRQSKGRETVDEVLDKLKSPLPHCKNFKSSATMFSLAKMVNTYSGFDQSSQTFIFPSAQSLLINTDLEARAIKNPNNFWNTLKPYRPIRLTLRAAQKLGEVAPSGIIWWALEKAYPKRAKIVSIQELPHLTANYEVGVLLVD